MRCIPDSDAPVVGDYRRIPILRTYMPLPTVILMGPPVPTDGDPGAPLDIDVVRYSHAVATVPRWKIRYWCRQGLTR